MECKGAEKQRKGVEEDVRITRGKECKEDDEERRRESKEEARKERRAKEKTK